MRTGRRSAQGFTLVELLVVITIIGMLTAMVFPAIGQVQEVVRRTICQQQMRTLHQATITFASQKQFLPAGVTICGLTGKGDAVRKQFYKVGGPTAQDNGGRCLGPNWISMMLQELEEPGLASRLAACVEKNGNACDGCARATDSSVGTQTLRAMVCPSAEKLDEDSRFSDNGLKDLAKGNYAANFGSQYMMNLDDRQGKAGAFEVVDVSDPKHNNEKTFPGTFKMKRDVGNKTGNAGFPDGETRTILYSEVVALPSPKDGRGAWAWAGMGASIFTAHTPPNANGTLGEKNYDKIPGCNTSIPKSNKLHCTTKRDSVEVYAAARSEHPNCVNTVMVGGGVRTVNDTVELEVWKALSTRRGNESVSTDE